METLEGGDISNEGATSGADRGVLGADGKVAAGEAGHETQRWALTGRPRWVRRVESGAGRQCQVLVESLDDGSKVRLEKLT